jgi:hypothetical protein
MKKCYNAFFILVFFIFIIPNTAFSQSITTGGINGTVLDETGSPMPGATIKAVHNPSNTTYGNTSRSDGKYNISNMRVGGPYTIYVSYVGYAEIKKENVYIELGVNLTANFNLTQKAMELTEVSVYGGRNNIISSDRTGASTNVSNQIITEFPTISRSFQDFYKFNAQFSGSPLTSSGTSANGRNNRYNNIQIDGAVYNDIFGLSSSGTPGGQTSTNPISLDAIQEFQVVIAPYDVRMGGFTGGGINAITRSGTNVFSGSVFGYGRNQDFVGKSPDASRIKYSNFNEYQTGFRLGGPIIKDQLFFFVNAEFTKKTTPIDNIAITQATNSKPDSIAKKFQSILQSKYGYDAKGYNTFDQSRPSTKLFAKLDFNLNESNKLSFRYNYVDASDDNMPRTIQNILFNDRNYQLKSTTGSAVLQLNTTFGNIANNELILGYTTVRDKRIIADNPFPSIKIYDVKTLIAGSEEFSIANKLDQDILELTDNFSYYMGDHVFTVGTHNEYFNFKNLYIQNKYGYYEFNSLSDFEKGKFSRYQYSYSLTGDPNLAAKFNVIQLGFYAQDEWTALTNLKLTGGLRIDIPIYPDKPSFNPLINTLFNLNTSSLPSGKVLFSPRIGVNWDVKSDQSLQVRGGIGMFTGKIPYVWISNQYGNTGIEFARIDYRYNAADSLSFIKDAFNQMKAGTKGIKAGSSEVDITDPDFKMPQILRFNAAVDQKLPWNYVATVEFVYSKTLNDILYQDINLGPVNTSLTGPGGRPVYGDTTKGTFSMRKVSQSFTNVILMKNTNDGYSYNISFQLQNRPTDMIYTSAGYSYGSAKDKNAGGSSRAISNYQYNIIAGDPNNPVLGISNFDIKHRVFAAISYNVEFFEGYRTTFSLFYNGQSGRPFSYVYNGDVNGDGNTSNDLLYIPKDVNDVVLTSNNYAALDKYINNDPYLSKHRGQNAERNAAREPWVNQLDFKFSQVIPVIGTHQFEISLDILNLPNLLKSTWGYVKTVPNQSDMLLKFKGYNSAGKQTYEFVDKSDPYQKEPLLSRWQMQLGVRYSF